MQELLPSELKIEVKAKPFALTEAALARADGVIVLLERTATPGKALRKLPNAALWQALYAAEARRGSEAPILVARLSNRRHTLAVVGFVKQGSSGFERLELAGKLAKEVVKPGVARVQVHALGFTADHARTDVLNPC